MRMFAPIPPWSSGAARRRALHNWEHRVADREYSAISPCHATFTRINRELEDINPNERAEVGKTRPVDGGESNRGLRVDFLCRNIAEHCVPLHLEITFGTFFTDQVKSWSVAYTSDLNKTSDHSKKYLNRFVWKYNGIVLRPGGSARDAFKRR